MLLTVYGTTCADVPLTVSFKILWLS